MREHSRYQAKYEPEDAPITVLYEFDTEEEVYASELLQNPCRTTCFASGGKFYIGGHFTYMDGITERRELNDIKFHQQLKEITGAAI